MNPSAIINPIPIQVKVVTRLVIPEYKMQTITKKKKDQIKVWVNFIARSLFE